MSDIFEDIVELLLEGGVICEYTNEDMYQYLQDNDHEQTLNQYLSKIGRIVKPTADNAAFFAAYISLDKPKYQTLVRQQITETMNQLEPLVRWLHLVSTSSLTDRPVSPGDVVKISVILDAVESSPVLCDDLALLSRSRMLSNTQSSAKGQIDAIMKKLVEYGYLIPDGRTGAQYIATGKWSHLYDVMTFISTHEQLSEEVEDQEDLPL